jgi:L-fucose isomerase-like protein
MKFNSISFDEIQDILQSQPLSLREIEQKRQEIITSYRVDTMDVNTLETGLRLHMALKQIAQVKRLDGFATECWSAFPRELGLNPCMGFIEDAYMLACEGDVMSLASLMMVKYLSGRRAYTGDVYDLAWMAY